ncbi:hypothetical protein BDV41DRAFT_523755 [Aspergillus transmontanensis]|uniref:Uncharacterized protein n=1 Tax=Aspergillus transmontanensis TaxID=1034304 RepID=A0A5N6WBL1_9EURO|nr:hypothetical protein BDV41DRAFT_523755 [Aspergillus transmontanensis]
MPRAHRSPEHGQQTCLTCCCDLSNFQRGCQPMIGQMSLCHDRPPGQLHGHLTVISGDCAYHIIYSTVALYLFSVVFPFLNYFGS